MEEGAGTGVEEGVGIGVERADRSHHHSDSIFLCSLMPIIVER